MAKGGKMWLELLGTSEQLEEVVLNLINKQFDNAVKKSIDSIAESVKSLVYKEIYNCNEMEALRGDRLSAELGLTSTQASQASENIAQVVSESIVVEKEKPSKKGGTGGFTLYIQPSNFQNVLNIPGSTISYTSKTYKEQVTLEWLDWLINRGDEIIVANFRFDPSGKGRGGMGKMKRGGSWRISPQYAGTIEDNFITRALMPSQEEIAKIIEKTIKKNWK